MSDIIVQALVAVVAAILFAAVAIAAVALLTALGFIRIDAVRLYRTKPLVTLRDARERALVRVRGTLRAEPGESVPIAPFTNRPCLYCQTSLEVHRSDADGGPGVVIAARETLGVSWARLADDSGTARVRLLDDGSNLQLRLSERHDALLTGVEMEVVSSWLERIGLSVADVEPGFPWGERVLPADCSLRQRVLLEGDEAIVAGAVTRRPGGAGGGDVAGYRAAPQELVLEAPLDRNETPLLVVTDERTLRKLGG